MAKNYVQIEVLLLTGTTFVAGHPVIKDDQAANRAFSENERLQEACWNGLLETMLPEVWIKPPNEGVLYLWEVRKAISFLELELSEVPLPVDPQMSISPRCFLSCQDYN